MTRNRKDIVHKAFTIRVGRLNGIYRVVFTPAKLDEIYLHRICDAADPKGDQIQDASVKKLQMHCRVPIRMRLSVFQALTDEQCSPATVTLSLRIAKPESTLTDEQKPRYQCVKKRMEQVGRQETLEKMLVLRHFCATLDEIAKEHEVHRTTLARDLARFFYCELDAHKAAMLAVLGHDKDEKACAARVLMKKQGRRRKCVVTGHDPDNEGINIPGEAKVFIGVLLQSTGDWKSITYAELFRRYTTRYATRQVGVLADGTIQKERNPALDITYGQFKHYVKKVKSKAELDSLILGASKFAKDKRILLGHSRELINYPGHTYIIDSTIADVYLVCSVDRKLLIGRPVIYVVIDAFSSLIVSVHVTLEGPDMKQAKVALFRAMTSKDKLLSTLGMSSLLPALPAGCRPTFVFSDRGELLSDGARSMAEALSISQSLAAPYRADWKSLVERYFGVQNTAVIHWLPGAVRERARERGDRDVRLDAVLTVNEFLRLLLSLAAEWNLTHDMSQHVSGSMLRAGIPANPISFWHYGLEAFHGGPKYLERGDAVRQLLPAQDVRITRQGVFFGENLRFTHPWMRDDDEFYGALPGDTATIFPDPDDPLSAFMLAPMSNELHSLNFVDKRRYREDDASTEDIRMCEEYLDLLRGDEREKNKPIVDTLQGQRDDIVKEAAKKTREAQAGDARPKSQRTANQRANRAASIRAEQSGKENEGQKLDGAIGRPVVDDAWTKAMQEAFAETGES
jgi:putative transposase